MPNYYHNQMLFSEIYLEEITRQIEDAEVLASLKVLGEYRAYADTQDLSAWKASYIHEVLSILGFYVHAIPADEKNSLFKGDNLSAMHPLGADAREKPLSLCYSLLPEEDLNNISIGCNWAEKIIRALRENDLQWGLLTNGKCWRIYHLDEPTPYETYLEIDLESILKQNGIDAYQIFHKFLKIENFNLDEVGKCQFDRFKQDSKGKIDYIEKELTKALKQREEGGKGVLSDLCMGYVEELRREGAVDLDNESERRKIYHAAMLYMFRLLFLFYADARGLLSDSNHSLLEQVEKESADLNSPAPVEPTTPLWNSLQKIFVEIDEVYNGGLFSPQESQFTRFISEIRIADSYLAKVVFNLSTYQERSGQVKGISYRDMSVRHLGTLYEGLLEHNLFIADENTEVKITKGKVQYIPISQGGKLKVGQYIPAGAVYFASDHRERKASGSYFTPEDVVDYIVENTVGEKLKGIKETFLKEQAPIITAIKNAINEEEKQSLAGLLESEALRFIRNEVLNLSILDPAMGSGHFLVNAVNLISNFITEFFNELGFISKTNSSTEYWRRWVVENCIYGVDINPLAVELAKLSLWILSMTKDQPLSYLNHHLKCGNSLVGARLSDIGIYPLSNRKSNNLQLSLFSQNPELLASVNEAVKKASLIASQGSETHQDVDIKKKWQEDLDRSLSGYKSIFNVHTGVYFDQSAIDENRYLNLVRNTDFQEARSMEKENNYFHWELEFPYILLQENGFDCVIGNPPYVDVSTDTFTESDFSTYQGRNLYNFFVERGLRLLKKTRGYLGYIIPISIITSDRMKSTREFIRDFRGRSKFINIDSSAHPGVLFPGLTLLLSIFIVELDNSSNEMSIESTNLIKFFNAERETFLNRINTYVVPQDVIVDSIIPKIGSHIEVEVLRKLFRTTKNFFSFIDSNEEIQSQKLFYKGTANNYIIAFKEPPLFEVNGRKVMNSKTKALNLHKEVFLEGAILVFSSTLFYWFWRVYSNCFDFTKADLRRFPIDLYKLHLFRHELSNLFDEISTELEDNGKVVVYNKSKGATRFFQNNARPSKPLFDKVDDLLGKIYGFSDEELQFVKTYDLRFRTDDRDVE